MPVDNPYSILIVVAGGLLALACLLAAFRFFGRKRLIDDLPTAKTSGVYIGLTELCGTAEAENPLTSYLAEKKCVYYSYFVQEQWRRIVTESYTDSKGRHRTRTRVESGWKTVQNQNGSIPFYLRDDTGVIRVLPEGAEIHAQRIFNRTCSPGDPLYYAKGPTTAIANSTHRRRFEEEIIPLHAGLYIFGRARERRDLVAAEIAADKRSPMFLISTRDEKHHSSRLGCWYWFWLVSGLVLAAGGVAVYRLVGEVPGSMLYPLLIAAGTYCLAALAGWIWSVYNSLVRLRQRLQQAWSQIDIELKRRSDLVPNLVAVVQEYRRHEREVQQLVTRLRGQEGIPVGNDGDLKGLVSVIRVALEKYPELKADGQFMNLHRVLVETEQRLALIRDHFNQMATFYNTRLEIVPDRFLASLAGFKPRRLLATSGLERAPVEVDLAD